jgi:hypothetical protein
MGDKVVSHRDLEIYKRAYMAAMQIFELSKRFPRKSWVILSGHKQ